jgi:hypothetical protein
MLNGFLGSVVRFQKEIIGYPMPATPTKLPKERAKARYGHIREEAQELLEADNLADQADACIDTIYVALGALAEMGVLPGPCFEEVHEANMRKVRGSHAKRPDHGGYDAVKPEGWHAPDHARFLTVTKADVAALDSLSPVLREVAKLRAQKGNDYNTGVQLDDYFPFGHESYAQMVYLKGLRLVSLVQLLRKGRTAVFEGLYDTVLDCINYAVFYGEWLLANRVKTEKGPTNAAR